MLLTLCVVHLVRSLARPIPLDMPARKRRGLSKVGNGYASKKGRSEQRRESSSSSGNANEPMDIEMREPMRTAVPIRRYPARMS